MGMRLSKSIVFVAATLLFSNTLFAIPRAEYPRPQFERADWVNLNGQWSYAIDYVANGFEKGYSKSEGFDGTITVPFAPESKLSGVGHVDIIPGIWYQRTIDIPAGWDGQDILLNFGAVYYRSEIYIDGQFVARHFGGSDSFSVDITRYVKAGSTHNLVVYACSDVRSKLQPLGKQSIRNGNFECMYTRTTGIWQTVWMEAVNPCSLARVVTNTDIDRQQVSFQVNLRNSTGAANLSVSIYDGGRLVAREAAASVSSGSIVTIPLKKARLWSPESPFLYDVVFELSDRTGKVTDKVCSYFGMRKIHMEGNRVYLNNQPYYQRLVLDQGFYPDGIWTAPSDEALKHDIEMSMAVGFNGARLHQKVFEERFHYWADKLGYLTWAEFPSWGIDANDPIAARNFLTEWSAVVKRDMNHPSIVTWTPFNEEFWPDEFQYPRFIEDVYDITKAIDMSRPVNTVSGGIHIKTDIWTHHDYEQDAQKLLERILDGGKMKTKQPVETLKKYQGNLGYNRPDLDEPHCFPVYEGGFPYIVDEFGGIKCLETNPAEGEAWGYGSAPQTREEFYTRLESQVDALLSRSDVIWGYCYTQLTDVMQEQNGIYYYDRSLKYDTGRLKTIFSKTPTL